MIPPFWTAVVNTRQQAPTSTNKHQQAPTSTNKHQQATTIAEKHQYITATTTTTITTITTTTNVINVSCCPIKSFCLSPCVKDFNWRPIISSTLEACLSRARSTLAF